MRLSAEDDICGGKVKEEGSDIGGGEDDGACGDFWVDAEFSYEGGDNDAEQTGGDDGKPDAQTDGETLP